MRFCRDVPVFVEVGEAGIAVECYAASAFVFNSLGDVLGLMSCKRSTKNGQVLVGFQSPEAFRRPIMPAAVQRNAIAAFRHRFTLRQTRRTVPIMFSLDFVAVKVQTEPTSKRQRKAFGISIPTLH